MERRDAASLGVDIELWPVSADPSGLWLVSGGAPLTRSAIPASPGANETAKGLLRDNGLLAHSRFLHSTSWRPRTCTVTLTYIAALTSFRATAPDTWPQARRLDLEELQGNPVGRGRGDAVFPDARVLVHGLRHLAFLVERDQKLAAVLGADFRAPLALIEPAVAGLFGHGNLLQDPS